MRDYPLVEIVISSTWRTQFSLAVLQAWFSPDIAARIIGVTPSIPSVDNKYIPARREREIRSWLETAGREHEPWLALDDAVWQFQLHSNQLIACIRYIGFDEKSEAALRARLSACS